jgi:hypothetical protein
MQELRLLGQYRIDQVEPLYDAFDSRFELRG